MTGRMFRGWGAAAFVGLLASPGCYEPPPPAVIPAAAAPREAPKAESVSLPAVKFVDITEDAGIDFVHCNATTGEKLLPETMGSGCAFLDYDADGDPDLLLINQCPWPWDAAERPDDEPRRTQALYRNDGGGKFVDVTKEAGLGVELFGMGAVVGDYDNDGDPDAYITTATGGKLFRNDAGAFKDVTAEANAGAGDGWLTSGCFFDLENDGDLDLFLCCYVEWSADYDRGQAFNIDGVGRSYGPPSAFRGDLCVLLRNEGDGTFADVSESSGVRVVSPALKDPMAKSLGVAPYDVDADGFVDLAVANDTVPNFLFRNRGDGTFEEQGITTGMAFDQSGATRGAMGIDWAHFRNDESLSLAVANFANEMIALYISDDTSDPRFVDQANVYGLGAPTQPPLKFGLFFFDYDLDGRPDLLSTNGHLETDIEKTQASETYRQPAQLYWNSGRPGREFFLQVGPDEAGADLFTPIVGRGSAYADIDGDGDLDVVMTSNGEKPRLFRNDGGNANHWLRLKLIGGPSNRDAIGARIVLEAGDVVQRRQVFAAKSYLSSVELVQTFGLGGAARAGEVTVTWPSGQVTELKDLEAGRVYTVREAEAPATE